MKTSDAFEIGKLLEFLVGITSAGVVPVAGTKRVTLEEFPNLRDNLPINRYSVMRVVESVKRLSALLEENGFTGTLAEMDEIREGLKEMEEFLGMNPSPDSFLRDPFADNLVANARKVEEKFREEMAAQ